MDIEIDALLRIPEARRKHAVDGSGMTVAVLDTGLRLTHVDFTGRIADARNFTSEGTPADASDGNGHGTNVAGIIAASGRFAPIGVAPGAKVIPLKILKSDGRGDFQWVLAALDWTIDHAQEKNIGVVSMSLGNGANYQSFEQASADPNANHLFTKIREKVKRLNDMNTIVVVAAGNDFFRWQTEGMSFPAIIPECISVGAVYDSALPCVGADCRIQYSSGAIALTTGPDRFTPFTQRLHASTSATFATDVFAPGAVVTSAGHRSDTDISLQSGTSQATPVVSGLVLLLQDYFMTKAKRRPTLSEIADCILAGSEPIVDGDDENDNVPHLGKSYPRISAPQMLARAEALVHPTGGAKMLNAADLRKVRAIEMLKDAKSLR